MKIPFLISSLLLAASFAQATAPDAQKASNKSLIVKSGYCESNWIRLEGFLNKIEKNDSTKFNAQIIIDYSDRQNIRIHARVADSSLASQGFGVSLLQPIYKDGKVFASHQTKSVDQYVESNVTVHVTDYVLSTDGLAAHEELHNTVDEKNYPGKIDNQSSLNCVFSEPLDAATLVMLGNSSKSTDY